MLDSSKLITYGEVQGLLENNESLPINSIILWPKNYKSPGEDFIEITADASKFIPLNDYPNAHGNTIETKNPINRSFKYSDIRLYRTAQANGTQWAYDGSNYVVSDSSDYFIWYSISDNSAGTISRKTIDASYKIQYSTTDFAKIIRMGSYFYEICITQAPANYLIIAKSSNGKSWQVVKKIRVGDSNYSMANLSAVNSDSFAVISVNINDGEAYGYKFDGNNLTQIQNSSFFTKYGSPGNVAYSNNLGKFIIYPEYSYPATETFLITSTDGIIWNKESIHFFDDIDFDPSSYLYNNCYTAFLKDLDSSRCLLNYDGHCVVFNKDDYSQYSKPNINYGFNNQIEVNLDPADVYYNGNYYFYMFSYISNDGVNWKPMFGGPKNIEGSQIYPTDFQFWGLNRFTKDSKIFFCTDGETSNNNSSYYYKQIGICMLDPVNSIEEYIKLITAPAVTADISVFQKVK